jgi:pimeloyl-ACP methyl ester carboxylesterase
MNLSRVLKLIGLLFGSFAVLSAQKELTGEIEGALYQISLPEQSNGKLVILAHGYRPESLPKSASYGAGNVLPQTLLDAGWTLASTSYRRNGWIMEDAGADLVNLRNFIEAEVMEPAAVYLMGNSMGAGVITWLSENHSELFDGGLCLGAYVYGPIVEDGPVSTDIGEHYAGKPKFPLLYLTNTTELEGPTAYIDFADEAEPTPVLWKIARAGHVNQNEQEQLSAFTALVDWANGGAIESNKDATIVLNPDSTAVISETGIDAVAQTLVAVYGNFITNIVRSDLEKFDLQLGDTFELSANGQSVPVLLGATYNDVSVGEWVAFWDADGYLLFCRNYKHAVNSLDLKQDNPLTLTFN